MASENSTATRGTLLGGVVAAWVLFEAASGGYVRLRFGTDTLAQHVYFMHVAWGLLAGLAALLLMFRAVGGRRGERPAASSGLLALASVLAAVSGLAMFGAGSTAGPSPIRDSHMVSSLVATALLLLTPLLARRARRPETPRAGFMTLLMPLAALALPLATMAVTMSVWPLPSSMIPFPDDYFRKHKPFLPGRISTPDKKAVRLSTLESAQKCGECHQEIYKQWQSSSHRNSTISKWYEAQLKLRMVTFDPPGMSGARFCGACHEPIVALSGNLDQKGLGVDYQYNKDNGITCVACHRIRGVVDTLGNGSYKYEGHQPYLFQNSDNPLLAAVGKGLVRAKPDLHAKDMMTDVLKTPEVCATCHHVFFKTISGSKFTIQSDYDTWFASNYNKGPKHPKTQRCQDCHMPMVDAADPAAKGGKVHSHRFIGANTARPYQTGDTTQLARTEEFLQQSCLVNVNGPSAVQAGSEAKFDVIVTNVNVGHNFPGGTTDMIDCWIEAIAKDAAGRVLFESGLVDPKSLHVDENAKFFRTVPKDRWGKRLFRRDLWNVYHVVQDTTIPPEKSAVLAYPVKIPADSKGPIRFSARLRFRRSNQAFTDFAFPDKQMQIPITDLADDAISVALGTPTTSPSQTLPPHPAEE